MSYRSIRVVRVKKTNESDDEFLLPIVLGRGNVQVFPLDKKHFRQCGFFKMGIDKTCQS